MKWNPAPEGLCGGLSTWKGCLLGKIYTVLLVPECLCTCSLCFVTCTPFLVVLHWFVAPWFHWAEIDIVSHDRKAQSWLRFVSVLLARESFWVGSQGGSNYGHSVVRLLCCQEIIAPFGLCCTSTKRELTRYCCKTQNWSTRMSRAGWEPSCDTIREF